MNTSLQDDQNRKLGFFARLKQKLNSGSGLGLQSLNWFSGRGLDDELEEEIEERLLLADVGVETTSKIISGLRVRAKKLRPDDSDALQQALRQELIELLQPSAVALEIPPQQQPFVILMVGVNGSGKTTTIGKLAQRFKQQGHNVLLAAGDTYRAAATEQLQSWGERNEVDVISQAAGADPAAVIYDAIQSAKARNSDIVLADTAGRLHSQQGLMQELQKIKSAPI